MSCENCEHKGLIKDWLNLSVATDGSFESEEKAEEIAAFKAKSDGSLSFQWMGFMRVRLVDGVYEFYLEGYADDVSDEERAHSFDDAYTMAMDICRSWEYFLLEKMLGEGLSEMISGAPQSKLDAIPGLM